MSRPLCRTVPALCLALAAGAGAAHAQRAATVEIEPNHPCSAAQSVAAVEGAFVLTGGRDSGDVDFIRVAGPPGALLVADLEGAGAGAGTLADGYLGAFSSDCASLLATDDESGAGSDARLQVMIPPGGSLVLAVTGWPDYEFTGAAGAAVGTYRLRTTAEPVTGAFSGRLVNAATGQPVSNASVGLTRCSDGSCGYPYQTDYTGADGRFLILSDPDYFPMTGGLYELTVDRSYYEPFSRLIEIHGKTDIDIGDVPLTAIPTVSSISGRVVDGVTGQPLAGDAPPHARVHLSFCYGGAPPYCSFVSQQPTGPDGGFRFEGNDDRPLETGSYHLELRADQYDVDLGDPFPAAGDEDRELGDVTARSYAVRVAEVARCGPLPSRGGRCRFTVGVSNGQAAPLLGRGWITVAGWYLGGQLGGHSWYQLPQRLIDLPPGGSAALPFTFDVPGTIRNGALLCATFYAAPKDRPLEPHAARDLFCLRKDGDGVTRVPDADLPRVLAAARGGDGGKPARP